MVSNINQALERAIPAIANDLQTELKIKAPVDTARLRQSIKVIVTNKGLLISMVNYGLFVEFGTPPHVIKPKSKKALKFGDTIVKKVNHPGTRPNPFIRTALKQKLPKIIEKNLRKFL